MRAGSSVAGCRFQKPWRWVESGLWPNGPGKLSPGFTLGFWFIGSGPVAFDALSLAHAGGAPADEVPRNHAPKIPAAPSGLLTLKYVSQGKPWAKFSRPVGPKALPTSKTSRNVQITGLAN